MYHIFRVGLSSLFNGRWIPSFVHSPRWVHPHLYVSFSRTPSFLPEHLSLIMFHTRPPILPTSFPQTPPFLPGRGFSGLTLTGFSKGTPSKGHKLKFWRALGFYLYPYGFDEFTLCEQPTLLFPARLRAGCPLPCAGLPLVFLHKPLDFCLTIFFSGPCLPPPPGFTFLTEGSQCITPPRHLVVLPLGPPALHTLLYLDTGRRWFRIWGAFSWPFRFLLL